MGIAWGCCTEARERLRALDAATVEALREARLYVSEAESLTDGDRARILRQAASASSRGTPGSVGAVDGVGVRSCASTSTAPAPRAPQKYRECVSRVVTSNACSEDIGRPASARGSSAPGACSGDAQRLDEIMPAVQIADSPHVDVNVLMEAASAEDVVETPLFGLLRHVEHELCMESCALEPSS